MSHRLTVTMLSATVLALVSCGGSLTPELPPTGLTYSENPATYQVGVPITPNVPSATGGAVDSFVVVPELPPGLTLDPASGVITGTLTTASERTGYSVTASNSGGSAATALSIGTDPRQVTVTVLQPGGPDAGIPVIESSGVTSYGSMFPPSPTGVIETRTTDGEGRATFTVPFTTPTGNVCFTALPPSGITSGFASRCLSLHSLGPSLELFHY